MIIVLSSSLLRLQSCYSNVVATPLCTTLEFSDRALAHWSPNSLCSGQLSSRHSFQPIASGGKRESAPFLPMLPHSLRPFHVCWASNLCPHMFIRRALIRLCDTAVHPSDRTSVCVLRTLATGPASRRVPAGSPRRVNIAAPLRWRGSSMLRVNWAWAQRSHCPSTTRWSVRRRYSASPRTEFSRCP